jgi:hypothetical protein
MHSNDASMETRVTRRRMLLMSVQFAGAGVFAGLLGACGQQASTPAAKPTEAAKPAAPAATTAPSTAATTAPAARPADAAKPAAAAPTQAAPASKPAGGSGGALKVAHFANPSQLSA